VTTYVKKLFIEFAQPLTDNELLATQAFLRKIKGAVRVRAVRERSPYGWRRSGDYHYYEDTKYGLATVIGPRAGVYRVDCKNFKLLRDAKAYVERRYGPKRRS